MNLVLENILTGVAMAFGVLFWIWFLLFAATGEKRRLIGS
jgi:hypothetical protein